MSVAITITNAGRAALVNAANTGTAAVVIAAIGLSVTAVTPDPTATALPNELKRVATVGGQIVADDIIHVTMTDASGDAYSARSFGIYLADGTLFALYGQADVLLTKTAASQGLLAVDLQFADASAASIAFGPTDWVNPPASESVWGVIKLATAAIAKAGADALSAITPATAKAAILDWLGFTPVQQGGGVGQGTNKIYLGWGSGSRLRLQVDNVDIGGIVTDTVAGNAQLALNGYAVRRNGNDLFGPDNDGAGSSLDAGLFWGQTPSFYTDIPGRLGYIPARGQGTLGNVDLNSATTSGMYRVEQPVNGPANVNYGQLLVMMGGGDTITQILSSYSDGVLWTRSGNPGNLGGSGGWSAWSALVKASSPETYSAGDVLSKLRTVDGAGSGVDGDTLRGYTWNSGQDVSFGGVWSRQLFTSSNGLGQNVAIGDDAWLGDVNVTDAIGVRGQQDGNRGYLVFGSGTQRFGAEYGGELTYNGARIWNAGNDGAGSGADTDLFRGLGPEYFTDIIGRLGWWPVQQGGGNGQGSNKIYIGWSGSRVKIQVDGSDQGNLLTDGWAGAGVTGFNGTAMRRYGNELWGPDNDGAGSGLDAGLFCGHNIDEFALKANTIGYGQSAQNVAGIRGFNQNYVNDTGRAFFLTINVTYPTGGSNIWLIYVDGVEVGFNTGNSSTNTSGSLCALVPAGSTYSANVPTGNVQLRSWTEIRNF